ncbi:transcriptional regulator [Aureimonas sp. SA4125]|nr:transcriptional regulator [Aureimonas sp. SA4125]
MARRLLTDGDKLPSIRAFAKTMGVSPSTVVEAYDRLAAEGVIRSRPGSGFYAAGATPPLVLADAEQTRDREIDPLWVSRLSLDASPGMLRPGCGWLPADWMPNAAIRRALREEAKAGSRTLVEYGAARGSLDLRRHLARQFGAEGIAANPEQILLASTGTQAIDLLCRFFLRPGDKVLLDDPCYFNFRALLRAHHVDIVSVPYTRTGPDTALFAAAVERHRPRLYITNSAIHNPTGASLSAQTAHRVLTAAAAHGMTIIEDDIFGDFEAEFSPRLAALDGLVDVVRVGSFSKTLSASIRCGYIAARPEWIEGLIDLQVATNFGGPSPIAADLILHTLNNGSYRKHLAALRLRLSRCRKGVGASLESLGIVPWTVPRGGFFLWCRLPGHRDAAHVAKAAFRQGVVLAPGNVFSPSQTAADWMRFNVAQMDDPRIAVVLREALGQAGT